MASNSILIKQESSKVEWFSYLLKPYVHYYPTANDLSDLVDVFDYLEAHQEEAQKIIQEANKFVDRYFTPDAMTREYCAVFRNYSLVQAEEIKRSREQKRLQEVEKEKERAEKGGLS